MQTINEGFKSAFHYLSIWFGLLLIYWFAKAIFLTFDSIKAKTKSGRTNTFLFCVIFSLALPIILDIWKQEIDWSGSITEIIISFTAALVARFNYYKDLKKQEQKDLTYRIIRLFQVHNELNNLQIESLLRKYESSK